MIRLGDFVRFVDEKMEGYVTRIIDDKTVGVTTEDFEIPVLRTKITRVFGEDQAGSAGEAVTVSRPVASFNENVIFLAVVSNPKQPAVVNFFIVNTTSYTLAAGVHGERSGKVRGEFSGEVAPGSSRQVFTASLSEVSSWPRLLVQLLYFTAESRDALKKPVEFNEKFTAKDFSGSKKQIPLMDQPGWEFRLDPQPVIIDAQKLKESFFRAPETQAAVARPLPEVDLHIEKLRDDHQFLTSSEMLTIQLAEFRRNLEAAVVHKLSSVIFIHGAGNGTLRHEIHKALGRHPGVKTFMDARKEKFGFGATEVLLK
ncbi:Smr/MutS family protein [Hufsiella ginkgonis]|uniref:DNA mismatch repair protein MutS n=1 Tax=Hufsiella ginkgonis TaxID=2695274 RepID=A0A7K1XUS5_9SPHI|nr:Smr/MutS family protein [Hufsiella ginkgonis]MXV14763.1 DNA mismatch repair protein MutS [Hufsiella ginkgonis]